MLDCAAGARWRQVLARTHALATLRNAYFAECIVIKRALLELSMLDEYGRKPRAATAGQSNPVVSCTAI